MKAVGIIVEYNPFHFGHLYHLEMAKKITNAEVVIAVVSGNFVQRGEPSMVSKEWKTRTALTHGVNLVIELPYLYAVQNADIFSYGALSLLQALQVEEIVFGAESGPTANFLKKYQQKNFLPPRLDELIRQHLDKGFSYPKAKSLALHEIHDFYLENPNDILGYAYLETIRKYQMNIQPHIIKRETNYKSTQPSLSLSARAIRKALLNNEPVSDYTDAIIDYNFLQMAEDYFPLLKYRILTSTPSQLRTIHLVDEGIEHLFLKQIKKATSLADFIQKCTSKRYSGARISRTITHILTNTNKDFASSYITKPPPYVRILGFDSLGQTYLSAIRKQVTIPIITRFEAKKYPLLQEELKINSVYFAIKNEPTKIVEFEKERSLYPIRQ
jgi:predicted nucleotidyltransferase